MRVETYATAEEFLADAGDWLLAREAENNIVLSTARLLTTDDHPFREPIFLCAVKDGDRIAGCALCPPPDQLSLTELPAGAGALVADSVDAHCGNIAAVSGPDGVVLEFTRAWTGKHGGDHGIRSRWRLCVLEQVIAPRRPAAGRLRPAIASDRPVLREWAPSYARDVNSDVDVAAFLERMLRRGTLYVWDDGGARSLVAVSGFTPNGARISAVYTPESFRGRGYATSAVAAVSRMTLDSGRRFVVLFADLDDGTPMRIYRSVGYAELRDHLLVDLA